MNDSILLHVGEVVCGSEEEIQAFKSDLLMYINSALMTLNQLGVGEENFIVTGENETWADFIGDESKYGAIRDCVTMKVKLAFDPPASSSALDSLERLIEQAEFRLSIQADPASYKEVT